MRLTKENIGLILKKYRQDAGLTQKEVATRLCRTQQIIGHWETGYAQPDADTLFSLCELYGVSLDEAFGRVNTKPIYKFFDAPLNLQIETLRRESGLSVAEFSNILGLSARMLEKLEKSIALAEQQQSRGNFYKKLVDYCKAEQNFNEYSSNIYNRLVFSENDEIMKTDLARELSICRLKLQASRADLAEALGLTELSIITWESGERRPNIQMLKVLDRALNLSDEIKKELDDKKGTPDAKVDEHGKKVAAG